MVITERNTFLDIKNTQLNTKNSISFDCFLLDRAIFPCCVRVLCDHKKKVRSIRTRMLMQERLERTEIKLMHFKWEVT